MLSVDSMTALSRLSTSGVITTTLKTAASKPQQPFKMHSLLPSKLLTEMEKSSPLPWSHTTSFGKVLKLNKLRTIKVDKRELSLSFSDGHMLTLSRSAIFLLKPDTWL